MAAITCPVCLLSEFIGAADLKKKKIKPPVSYFKKTWGEMTDYPEEKSYSLSTRMHGSANSRQPSEEERPRSVLLVPQSHKSQIPPRR